MSCVVDDQQLVDAEVLGEKLVCGFDRVLFDFALVEGVDLIARGHGLGDEAVGVAWLDHAPGQQAEQFVVGIDDGEGAEAVAALAYEVEHLADLLVGVGLDRLLDEAVNVVFHAGDFFDLLLVAHVVVNQAHAAVERHLDRHLGFGYGVHIGRDDRNLQLQGFGEAGAQIGLTRKHFRVKRGERYVVVRQARW